MSEHTFSPITNKVQFDQALEYVALKSQELLKAVTGEDLPLESVRLFAHTGEEYQDLERIARSYGSAAENQPGSGLYIACDMHIAGHHVRKIGIRPPDPDREQVGHADYTAPDYKAFVAKHHKPLTGLTRPLPGREDQLFEVCHPDFDVLAYVVNNS
ncbi:MAG TPA: hypothetical protein VLH86_05740 [Patescibacteria group bacterium]|nr:hypothetical protein [Patescibacteria group bacterium]